MTDHFRGFRWGMTSKDKAVDNMVMFVIDIFIKGGHGCPEIILTDNGKDVANQLI